MIFRYSSDVILITGHTVQYHDCVLFRFNFKFALKPTTCLQAGIQCHSVILQAGAWRKEFFQREPTHLLNVTEKQNILCVTCEVSRIIKGMRC
jgi:hypothetical protein